MTAPSKETVAAWEAERGFGEDGLSYQLRCSRYAAYKRSEEEGQAWSAEGTKEPQRQQAPVVLQAQSQRRKTMAEAAKESPVYGKMLYISPLMKTDKNRYQEYDEPVGPEMEVEEANAGELLYNKDKSVQREVADYIITKTNPHKQTIARSHIPKINTEITYTCGKDLVPVARGNNGETGYMWIFPSGLFPVYNNIDEVDNSADLTFVQLLGLKTLIQQHAPELLEQFTGEHIIKMLDGVTMVADIPQTIAILKKHARQERRDVAAGISY